MKIEHRKECLNQPDKVAGFIRSSLDRESAIDQDKEHFYVIGLNARNVIRYCDLVAIGGASSCTVSPMEIFRLACIEGASGIILAHNHPSGDPSPSRSDRELTNRLIEGGVLLGIQVQDHIVIGGNGSERYLSFLEAGLLYGRKE